MRRPLPLDRLHDPSDSDARLTAADAGLTTAEARARRARYGDNAIVECRRRRWRDLALDTARDPIHADDWALVVVASALVALIPLDWSRRGRERRADAPAMASGPPTLGSPRRSREAPRIPASRNDESAS